MTTNGKYALSGFELSWNECSLLSFRSSIDIRGYNILRLLRE